MNKAVETVHASLGASTSHRWMNCPGSTALYERLPPGTDTASIHAQEGTAAHALGEMCLRKGMYPEQFIGTEIKGFEVDWDMAEAVDVYVRYCMELQKVALEWWIEKRFSLNSLQPPAPMFGTSDFAAVTKVACAAPSTLEIVDYKHGSGVFVDVEGNTQLMYYALGVALELDGLPEEIKMTVIQPRCSSASVIRSTVVSWEDLLAFAVELLKRAEMALTPEASRHVGSWCRWCRAAAICPEKAAEAVAVAQSEFSVGLDIDPPKPTSLTTEELTWVLTQLPALEEWVRQVYAHATALLDAGQSVPGFKLVAKRATRKWADDAAVLSWADLIGLSDEEIYERKMRSVAQMEKIVGKGKIPAELVDKKSSGSIITPETDVRPALNPGSEFDPVE